MEREEQQHIFIELEDPGSRRSGVVFAIVVMLLVALVLAPPVLHDLTAPAERSRVSMPASRSASPALCHPSIDVPQMLDPLARIVLPGWTRLCGWIVESDIAEPVDPSG